MAYEEIIYDVSEGVATVTLNRPDKLNAWTMRMGQEVEQALSSADGDPAARVIVITGAGKGFCAGADLSLLSQISAPTKVEPVAVQSVEGVRWPVPFNAQLSTLRKPVLAAINGHAIGMGLALALCCDMRYASSNAKLSTVFSKLGLVAEYGLAWTLPRLIGLSRAFDVLYSSRMIDAAESLSLGLVDAVYPSETLMLEVRKRAVYLASTISPRSLSIMRRQVYDAASQTLEQAADVADREMRISLQTPDFREGLAAFHEKRTPQFPGI